MNERGPHQASGSASVCTWRDWRTPPKS